MTGVPVAMQRSESLPVTLGCIASLQYPKKGVGAMDVDISEHKRADEALRDSADAIAAQLALRRASFDPTTPNPDSRYQLLFDHNVAGFYRTAPDGRVLGCNTTFARMLGYASREEVLGCPAEQFYFSAEKRDRFLKDLQREGSLVNSELCLRRKDGSSIWVVENVAATCDEQGNLTLIEGTMVDISQQKFAEGQHTIKRNGHWKTRRLATGGSLKPPKMEY